MSQGIELTDRISRWGIVGPFITGFGLLFLGLVLKEGKKKAMLFLRPFNSIANELAMNAVSSRLGNNITAVALDDGTIPSPRSSFREIFVGIFLFLPVGLLLLLFCAITLPNAIDKLADPSLSSVEASLPAIISCYFGIFAVGKAFRSLFPKSNKLSVKSDKSLSKGVFRVSALSTWLPRMFIPRSLIIQSSDNYWKKSVEGIGEHCDYAVIDLTRMSESMSWELSYPKTTKKENMWL